MYTDAMAKEQAVRKAMAEPAATEAMLKAVHEAIATYEAVVKTVPDEQLQRQCVVAGEPARA